VGRMLGTPVAARFGRARAVRAGGFLAVAGVLVTVLAPWSAALYAGALLWALGICLVFPAAVSAAGESDRPGDAIALVTTIGYASILIGPPLIGALADGIGLGRALLSLLALAAGVVALGRPSIMEPEKRQPASASIAR
jgi:MFS family permease